MKENEGRCHLLLGAADVRNNQVFKFRIWKAPFQLIFTGETLLGNTMWFFYYWL